jgi:DNA-binding HxlR family transcriptional regulator
MSDSAWRILGKRWTFADSENYGLERSSALLRDQESPAGISSTMLSERLLELKREGLVAKRILYSKVEYSLTASARELGAILAEPDAWWSILHPAWQRVIANYQ